LKESYLCIMKLQEAKEQFIQLWGVLGTSWGINRTMAQIHALLLISPTALSTEDVMAQLSISRGNANMNLRDLMTWNLIYKELKQGERRDFFRAEKDIWEVAKRIIKERKRREIEPLMQALVSFNNLSDDKKNPEVKAFLKSTSDINHVVGKMDNAVSTLLQVEESKLAGILFSILKK